jgi:excisionase family DNA binding protein
VGSLGGKFPWLLIPLKPSDNPETCTMENAFSTIGEISQYLKLRPSTIYAMVAEKRIPHFKVGRLLRFKKSEIDLWMEGNRKECFDTSRAAKRVLKAARTPARDINRVVKKAIEQSKRIDYTASHGKPDQVKGLGKEVPSGTV